MLLTLHSFRAQAQYVEGNMYANLPVPQTTNCYGNVLSKQMAASPAAVSSTHGSALTPHGNHHILVIFAGFTEDYAFNQQTPPSPICWDYSRTEWPQNDGINPIGASLPANLTDFGYTAQSQFNPAATDQTVSNFLYQMSQTAANPFRATFGYFPERINVSRTVAIPGDITNYSRAVLDQINQRFPNYDWSPYDQHVNNPYFQTDNSGISPDGKIDYVVICWRAIRGGCSTAWLPADTGLAGVPAYTFPATGTRPAYSVTTGHLQTGITMNPNTFLHELGHTLYGAPHMWGMNSGTTGQYWNQTYGWGMMPNINTFFSANAWERWYLGWSELKTGAAQVSSDIQNAASLTATGGTYTLRDFVTTGDAIRIRLPNTNQHLWLENRAKNGPFDQRNTWLIDGGNQPFAAPPAGLVAMMEDMASDQSQVYNLPTNGMRTVSAQGNYDYTHSNSGSSFNQHLWNPNPLMSVHGPQGSSSAPVPNPTSNHNEMSVVRFDFNGDGVIGYNPWDGNSTPTVYNETNFMWVERGVLTDGALGPRIGTRQVGSRYGLDSNPMIIPHQVYDQANERLTQIPLNGLSVQVTAYDAATGDLTVQVRYNDTKINQSTRWTGDLKTYPVANAYNGSEVYVNSGRTLTLDRSGTAQRVHRGPGNDFVNDTRLTVSTGTRLQVASAGALELRGQGTTLYIDNGASAGVGGGSYLLASPGTTISVQYRADLGDGGQLILKTGSQLIIRSTGQVIPGTQRAAFPAPYPNPGTAGAVSFAWPTGTEPADAAGFRYEVQNLQGHPVRKGTCRPGQNDVAGVAAGLYLLVTTSPEGERQTRRVEVR